MKCFSPKAIVLTAILALQISNSQAASPHTWHTVSATTGTWDVQLQMLNQGGYFVARDGSPLSKASVNATQSFDYGFVFNEGDNFDVAYTLTAISKDDKQSNFTSKACVYVVTASGPAKPDVRVSSFNGAKCDWQVIHGIGENFIFS